MENPQWQQKKDLFAAAAELPSVQRDDFLCQNCKGDAALRAEIQMLLDHLDASHASRELIPRQAEVTPAESLQPGEVLASRFRIERFIGKGGMGEVYEAEDLELTARVALKTLRVDLGSDPQFLVRFKREVNLARQITHPNICRVFDVGFDGKLAFLTMELLIGESLAQRLRKGRLANSEVEYFAVQILEALAAAHAQRITHRDLKPGNVTITKDGVLKLLDFGLAKLLLPSVTNDDTADMALDVTRVGVVLGTVGYMSPEQALGKSLDERSDLFSFGVVLYEMATGRRTFGSGHPNEVMTRLVTEQPESALKWNPGLSRAIVDVLESCLEKDPAKRCPSAMDALARLRGASSAIGTAHFHNKGDGPYIVKASEPVSRRRWIYAAAGTATAAVVGVGAWKGLSPRILDSLAILPFANEGPPENEFLTDGFTENLINEVSAGALRVISRSAVYRFARKEDAVEIAKKLGVAAVMTGRILHRGDSMVTLSAELIKVATSEHLWGKRIDTATTSLQTLQGQMAGEVLAALRILRRPAAAQFQVAAAIDPVAYELYLKGRQQWNKRTTQGSEKAIEYFQQAIERVPTYAAAYAGLADVYWFSAGTRAPREVFPRSLAASRKAIALDPTLAEAQAALAMASFYYEWDWKGTEIACKRAIELNPSYASGHSYYGRFLSGQKRFTEAFAQLEQAQALDPLAPAIGVSKGVAYYLARRYPEASVYLQNVLNNENKFSPAPFALGVVRIAEKRFDEALALIEQGLAISPTDTAGIADRGLIYGLKGNHDKAQEALAQLTKIAESRYVVPYFFSWPYIGMGQKDKAMDWIGKALDDRSHPMPVMGVEPKMDPLRSEPRFAKLLARLQLPY